MKDPKDYIKKKKIRIIKKVVGGKIICFSDGLELFIPEKDEPPYVG